MITQLIAIVLLVFFCIANSTRPQFQNDETCAVVESETKRKVPDYVRKALALIRFSSCLVADRDSIVFHVLSHCENDENEVTKKLREAANLKRINEDINLQGNLAYKNAVDRIPINLKEIQDEMLNKSNQISFKKIGNDFKNDSMHDTINKIEIDHEIRILVHGWTDSLDSLHLIFRHEWPILIAGEWRYYENVNNKKVHVIFVNYKKMATSNYRYVAIKTVIHEVAKTILELLEKIYLHYQDVCTKAHYPAGSMLTFDEYMKQRVQAAGHSLGGQVLGALGHLMSSNEGDRKGKPTGKLGIIYGLDVAGIFFDYRRPHQTELKNFFHLDRSHGHRVILLLTERKERGTKYAEGHYNFYVNGPIETRDPSQPGCEKLHNQTPESFSHQRALNIFRSSLKIQSFNLFIGYKYERSTSGNKARAAQTTKYPYNSGTFTVIQGVTLIFGINQEYAVPDSNAAPEIYFLPTANCSPYNYQIAETVNELPQQCTEFEHNQNPDGEPEVMREYIFK